MKHLIVIAIVLFSTAAKADWTPTTVTLNQFEQGLYNAPKAPTAVEVYSHLKSRLSALIGWANTK